MLRTNEYWVDNFIRFLIEGKREVTLEEIEVRKKILGLAWLKGPFVVVMVAPDYSTVKWLEKDNVLNEYEKFLRRELDRITIKSCCMTNSYNNIVVLLAYNQEKVVSEEINTIFIDIQKKLVKRFGLEVFIGIGSIASTFQEIAISASDAQEMLGYKYKYADSGIVNISNMVQFQYNVSRGNGVEFERVIGCFQDGNLGKMELRLNELIESVRHRPNVSNTSIRRTLIEITVHILHTASNAGIDVELVLNNVDPYRWIMNQNHTEVITDWIMKISSELLMLINNKKANEEKVVIQQVRQYISENLGCIDLGLQQVSEYVGLSSTYCSQLFKKEVGMGINMYITHNRIAQAQKLLSETQLTSSDISKQLGYTSAGYFGQVFKKIVGITPQEYRRNSRMCEKE